MSVEPGAHPEAVRCLACATPVLPGEPCVKCYPRAAVVRVHALTGEAKSVFRWTSGGAVLGLLVLFPMLVVLVAGVMGVLHDNHVVTQDTSGIVIALWSMISVALSPILGEALGRMVGVRRARNRAIAPVHARIDALPEVRALGAPEQGQVRLRGRVRVVAPVQSVEGASVGAYETHRGVGNEAQSASGGGVFELLDEAGHVAAVVHASSARVAGPPRGGTSNVELRVSDGDEVEVVGRALWTASTREVHRGGLRGSARELHLRGTEADPVCMRVVRKRPAVSEAAPAAGSRATEPLEEQAGRDEPRATEAAATRVRVDVRDEGETHSEGEELERGAARGEEKRARG